MRPILKSVQINQCPSEKQKPSDNPADGASNPGSFIDYSYNNVLGSEPSETGYGRKGSPIVFVLQPALTVALVESTGGTSTQWDEGCILIRDCLALNAGKLALIADRGGINPFAAPAEARHLGGHNFAFADGHVKWYKSNNDPSPLRDPNTGAAPSGSVYAVYHYRSSVVYTASTSFAVSGNAPTFNARNP